MNDYPDLIDPLAVLPKHSMNNGVFLAISPSAARVNINLAARYAVMIYMPSGYTRVR